MSSQNPGKQSEQDESNPIDPRDIAADEILGARQWRRSKLGYITGAGTVADSARSVVDSGKGALGRLRGLAKLGFGREQSGRAVPDHVRGAEERFAAAMQMNGKTPADIASSIGTTYRQSLFFAVLLGLSVVLGVLSLFVFGLAVPQFPLVDLVFRLIPVPLLGALLFRSAYTNWMFRRRALLPVSDFFNAEDRMPQKKASTSGKPPAPRSRAAAKVVGFLFAAMIAGSVVVDATPALANPPQDYRSTAEQIFDEPKRTDLFVQLLAFLVPGVGPVPDSSVVSSNVYFEASKVAFMTFSGTLLFLGSAIAGWQIMSGIVAAAKEGKVLGQAYHEVWAPARMVIGFGMLAPIAGGLCAAQIVVLYMIVFGGNLANIVWRPYINTITMTNNLDGKAGEEAAGAFGGVSLSLANSTLKELLSKELCWSTLKSYLDLTGAFDPEKSHELRWNWIYERPEWRTMNAADDITLAWDDGVKHVYDYGRMCGKITVYIPKASDEEMEKNIAHQVATEQLQQVKNMQQALHTSENGGASFMTRIANSYISRDMAAAESRYFREGVNHDDFIEHLTQLRRNYVDAITVKVRDVYNSDAANGGGKMLDQIRDQASDTGWAGAGVFYLTLSRVQNAIYAAAGTGSRYSATYGSGGGPSSGGLALVRGTDQLPGVVPDFEAWWERNIRFIGGDLSAAAMASEMTDNGWQWMNDFFRPMLGIFRWEDGINPLNPMHHMIEFGNKLMMNGTIVYSAIALAEGTAGAVTGAADAIPGASAISGAFKGFAAPTFGALAGVAKMMALVAIAAGAVHAYIMPMIPYIMTAFFVGGMVILTVEALVAAPIWAFFHIRMDGQDFVSDVQKPGYMIAFNLLLRPALMIFGLILSYLVFGGMAWFVEKTFFPTADSMSSSMGMGPLGMMVMIVMVTYIHYQMAIRAFSLITQVPDRVSRWFGQGGEHLGEEQDSEKSSALIVRESSSRIEGVAKFGGMSQMLNRGKPGVEDKGPQKPGSGTAATTGDGSADTPSESTGKRG